MPTKQKNILESTFQHGGDRLQGTVEGQQAKADFVYNFMRFIELPDNFISPEESLKGQVPGKERGYENAVR